MLNGRMGEVGLSAVPLDLLDLFVSDVCRGAGFRRVCIVAKIASSCPSVCYACVSTAHTGRICVKFGIGVVCDDLSKNSRFGYDQTEMDTIREDLRMFYCFRRH
jgi:hypothetical protein